MVEVAQLDMELKLLDGYDGYLRRKGPLLDTVLEEIYPKFLFHLKRFHPIDKALYGGYDMPVTFHLGPPFLIRSCPLLVKRCGQSVYMNGGYEDMIQTECRNKGFYRLLLKLVVLHPFTFLALLPYNHPLRS